MNLNSDRLSVISAVLSIIALVASLGVFFHSERPLQTGKPSFDIDAPVDFYIFETFTRLTLRNNGTATAHNIRVNIIFTGVWVPNWEVTEFIPELSANDVVVLEIPIGTQQLRSIKPPYYGNSSSYEALVHITCNELPTATSFYFRDILK